jgi:predicted nucleic-acid-binding Zn-ribbon protein
MSDEEDQKVGRGMGNHPYVKALMVAGWKNKCPSCGNENNWGIATHQEWPPGNVVIVKPFLYAEIEGQEDSDNVGKMSVIPIVCDNCGFLMLYSEAHLKRMVAKNHE